MRTKLIDGNEYAQTTIRYRGKKHTVISSNTSYNNDKMYVFSNEYGPTHIIRAGNESEAYEEYLDCSPTVDASELEDAYEGENLLEGYEYQPNASGTGIVWVGYYLTIDCVKTGLPA